MWGGYTDWDNDNDDRHEIIGLGWQISKNEEKIKEIESQIQLLENLKIENLDEEELVCQGLDKQIASLKEEIAKLQEENASYQAKIDELEREL